MNVIGLMSGTSVDGVDAVLCKINPDLKFEVLASKIYEYPLAVKNEILKLIKGEGSVADLCTLNFVLGNFYADCVKMLCEDFNFDIKNVDLISSHGQTIYHNPTKETLDGYSKNSTLQIGELSCITKNTGVATIGDFRPCDMAVGGQGAPLVPYFDKIVFDGADKNLAIQNLGGIANVTILGKNGEFLAFDNAPANALIDFAMQKLYNKPYDKDGEIALSTNYDKELLDYIVAIDDFIKIKPPKSTGKEHYSVDFLNKIIACKPVANNVLISTLAAYTAFAIADSYKEFSPVPIDEIILGGGGVKNNAVVKYLKDFTDIKVKTHNDYGISDDFKEAIAFAVLGYQRYFELTNNEPCATGAKRKVSMGKLVLP